MPPSQIALGFPRSTRQKTAVTVRQRLTGPFFLLLLLTLVFAGVVYAQLEGGEGQERDLHAA